MHHNAWEYTSAIVNQFMLQLSLVITLTYITRYVTQHDCVKIEHKANFELKTYTPYREAVCDMDLNYTYQKESDRVTPRPHCLSI